MNVIVFIVATIASMLVFKALLNSLNDRTNILEPVQRFVNRADRRKVYKNVAFFMIIVGNVYVKNFFSLNYMEFGLTLGFLITLYNIIFEYDKK